MILGFLVFLLLMFFAFGGRWQWRGLLMGASIGLVIGLVLLLPMLPFVL